MDEIAFPEHEPCRFCEIIADPSFIHADMIASNTHAVAFLDSYPLNPGHALIIPRRHTADLFHLQQEEYMDFFGLLPAVRTYLTEHGFEAEGYNVSVNVGLIAGQTISHLHLHLIPRISGDCEYDGVQDPRGGVRWVIPARAAYWND